MAVTPVTVQRDLDSLRSDFIVAVSVLGGVLVLVLCLVLALFIWNIILQRKIRKLDPLSGFKLSRPKLINTEHSNTPKHTEQQKQQQPQQHQIQPQQHNQPYKEQAVNQQGGYENPGFMKGQVNKHAGEPINPIASRSKTNFDNGNFIFGNDPRYSSSSNYVNRDSKYY